MPKSPLESLLGGFGYGYGLPQERLGEDVIQQLMGQGQNIARPILPQMGATPTGGGGQTPHLGRWKAEPNIEGGQKIGNMYEARESKDYPDMVELWVSREGDPMRLFRVRSPEEIAQYIQDRVNQGWFKKVE